MTVSCRPKKRAITLKVLADNAVAPPRRSTVQRVQTVYQTIDYSVYTGK